MHVLSNATHPSPQHPPSHKHPPAPLRTLLAREQRRIRDEYEARLQELERERTSVGQDRAQVAQYQALVVKQRDIMLALTQRLTERDDTVLGLQEEVEGYDSRVKYVHTVGCVDLRLC